MTPKFVLTVEGEHAQLTANGIVVYETSIGTKPVEPSGPIPNPTPEPPPADPCTGLDPRFLAVLARRPQLHLMDYIFQLGRNLTPEERACARAHNVPGSAIVEQPKPNPNDLGGAEREDPYFGWRPGSMTRHIQGRPGSVHQRPLQVPSGWRGSIHVQGEGQRGGFDRINSFTLTATDSRGKILSQGGGTQASFTIPVTEDIGTILLTYTIHSIGGSGIGGGLIQVNIHPAK